MGVSQDIQGHQQRMKHQRRPKTLFLQRFECSIWVSTLHTVFHWYIRRFYKGRNKFNVAGNDECDKIDC